MSLATMVGPLFHYSESFDSRISRLTRSGTPPDEFRGLAREQISKYPSAHFKNGTVKSITPTGTDDVSVFTVTDDAGKNYTARKIVLGTGLRDVLPDTPGLEEGFGKGIWWCPWCDGWEVSIIPYNTLL